MLRGEPTGPLSGSAAEGERLIMARDAVAWDAAEGVGNPEVRATVGPPAEPSKFANVEDLEAAQVAYFGPGTGREGSGMAVGGWDGNNSMWWTHPRGFIVHEILLRECDSGMPFTDFEMEVLNHLNCCPAQLAANAWRSLKFLQYAAWTVGRELTVRLFLYWFSVKLGDNGRVNLQRKGGALHGFPASISNWKNWKDRYFPVVCNHFERPWWVREEDGRPVFPVAWSDAITGTSPIKRGHLSEEERRTDRLLTSFYKNYEQTCNILTNTNIDFPFACVILWFGLRLTSLLLFLQQ